MSIMNEIYKCVNSKDATSLREYLHHLHQVNEMAIANRQHEDEDIQIIDIKKYLDR